MTPNDQRWREKYGPWALITGASDGIGREFAHRLADAGLSLVLVARRRGVLGEIAADLTNRYGIEAEIVEADLGTDEDVRRVIETTRDMDVGLVVACAGFGTSGPLIDSPLERELDMLQVNCRAVLALTHEFARRFARQRRGGIVLMSSLVGFQGVPGAANYAATKAYVQSLAEALRLELAPFGVDVVSSAPGPIHTGFAARADMRMSMALGPKVVAQQTLAALGRRGTVRPGWLSKFLEAALKLPRWARVRIMKLVMGGMTKHQDRGATSEAAKPS